MINGNISEKAPEIAKSLRDLSEEYNLSLFKLQDIYLFFNRGIYKLDEEKTNVHKVYDSELENSTLEMVKFSLKNNRSYLEKIWSN